MTEFAFTSCFVVSWSKPLITFTNFLTIAHTQSTGICMHVVGFFELD